MDELRSMIFEPPGHCLILDAKLFGKTQLGVVDTQSHHLLIAMIPYRDVPSLPGWVRRSLDCCKAHVRSKSGVTCLR